MIRVVRIYNILVCKSGNLSYTLVLHRYTVTLLGSTEYYRVFFIRWQWMWQTWSPQIFRTHKNIWYEQYCTYLYRGHRLRETSFCFLKFAAFDCLLDGLSLECGDSASVLESNKANPTKDYCRRNTSFFLIGTIKRSHGYPLDHQSQRQFLEILKKLLETKIKRRKMEFST